MNLEINNQIINAGKTLINKGLVVRTWGNVSVKCDDNHIAISPSGMSYDKISAEDIPVIDLLTGDYTGRYKPSSEKLVHIAAYKKRDYAGAIVHTHQNHATATGLVFDEGLIDLSSIAGSNSGNCINATEDEQKQLGGIAVAGYGLPGTVDLEKQVEKALDTGADIILMKHHGVMVVGTSMEEALHKAELLEQICERFIDGVLPKEERKLPLSDIYAQLDDMAQMIGYKLPVVNEGELTDDINEKDAYIIGGDKAVVNVKDVDDAMAMHALIDKAILCRQLTDKLNIDAKLSEEDCMLMRDNYINNYSKLIKK